jgi:hypothetical protein
MNMKFAAVTALASSLLVLPLMQGSAQSASVTGLGKPLTSTAGTITLVHGGGGGRGGGLGGGHMGGGWDGGHIASRQAAITGSPYWWNRYNACVGYS